MQLSLGPDRFERLIGERLRQNFRVVEVDKSIEPSQLVSLFAGVKFQRCVALIVRNAVSPALCERVARNFWQHIESTGGNRKGDTYVKVVQIGASQFSKSSKNYMRQVAACRGDLETLFQGLTAGEREALRRDQEILQICGSRGALFRASQFKGMQSSPCTARAWLDEGSYSLQPHEDAAQLAVAARDGFEIGRVKQVVTQSLCLENHEGGEVIVWNIAPARASRDKLGINTSGYPYPLPLLEREAHLEMRINVGDMYFLNSNFVHAVRQVRGGLRVSLGRFLGAVDESTLVYWT